MENAEPDLKVVIEPGHASVLAAASEVTKLGAASEVAAAQEQPKMVQDKPRGKSNSSVPTIGPCATVCSKGTCCYVRCVSLEGLTYPAITGIGNVELQLRARFPQN